LLQQQRSKQAEGGVQLRNVAREVHGREYSGFVLAAQYFSVVGESVDS
jgi:hypothetical protein